MHKCNFFLIFLHHHVRPANLREPVLIMDIRHSVTIPKPGIQGYEEHVACNLLLGYCGVFVVPSPNG